MTRVIAISPRFIALCWFLSVVASVAGGWWLAAVQYRPQRFSIERLELELQAARREAQLHARVANTCSASLDDAIALRNNEMKKVDSVFDSYRTCMSFRKDVVVRPPVERR